MFLSDSLLILLPIAKCNDFEYFPSSNISPNNKYFFDLFDLILSPAMGGLIIGYEIGKLLKKETILVGYRSNAFSYVLWS